MARELTFRIKKKEFKVSPVRVDRKKLYGWTEVVAQDANGDPCRIAGTDDSGTVIIPKGGTGLGIVSEDGEWVDRDELVAVDENGDPAKLHGSSFASVIDLTKKISANEFLDYSINVFYQLTDSDKNFVETIGRDIYFFEYCYFDGCEGYPAFIMISNDGSTVFMLVGVKNVFEMLSLEQPGWIDEDDEGIVEIDEDIDFSLL